MRVARILLSIGFLAVATAIAAAVFFLRGIDLNQHRAQIAAQVSQASGRELALAGDAEFAFSLTPTVVVYDVAFANAEWGSRPQMITAKRIEARIKLLPLILGEIRIKRLVLFEPEVLLETDAEGRGNWLLDVAETPFPGGMSEIPGLGELWIKGGRVTYLDGATGIIRELAVKRFTATATALDSPLEVSFVGAYNGRSFSVSGTLGALARLDHGEPYPFALEGEAEGVRVALEGAIDRPLAFAGLDVAVAASGEDVAGLAPFAGRELPPLGPFAVRLRLSNADGRYRVSELSARVGRRGDLFVEAHGAIDDALAVRGLDVKLAVEAPDLAALGDLAGLDLPALGPVTAHGRLRERDGGYRLSNLVGEAGSRGGVFIEAKGTVGDAFAGRGLDLSLAVEGPDLAELGALAALELPPLGPVVARGRLRDTDGSFTFEDVAAAIGGSELSGVFVVGPTAAPARFEAEVSASTLDLRELLRQRVVPSSSVVSGDLPDTETPPRVFSDTPLPFDVLKSMDARIVLQAEHIIMDGAIFDDVAIDLSLTAGVLEARLATARYGGGTLSAETFVDARNGLARLRGRFEVAEVDIGRFLSEIGVTDLVEGVTDVAVDVEGAGNSVRDIMAGLGGRVSLVMGEGRIASRYIDFIAADLVEEILPGGPETSDTKFNCFVSRFDIAEGLASSGELLFDTQRMTVVGEGTVDLGTETLDLILEPEPKNASLFSLATPMRVEGTLTTPTVRPDSIAVAKTAVGAVIGAITTGGIGLIVPFISAGSGNENPCVAAMGAEETLPADAAGDGAAKERNDDGLIDGAEKTLNDRPDGH